MIGAGVIGLAVARGLKANGVKYEIEGDDLIVEGGHDRRPHEWKQRDELERLARTLIERRKTVRGLIEAFRTSPRRPFPGWVEQA